MKKLLLFLMALAFCATANAQLSVTQPGGYCIQGGIASTVAPADATTYYFGGGWGMTIGSHTTYGNAALTIPRAGTIIRVQFHTLISTNGTSESVSHFIRVNNTTDTTLSTSETYDPGANTAKDFNYTGLSIAVATGDTVAFKVTAPTWATNPTMVAAEVLIFIQ